MAAKRKSIVLALIRCGETTWDAEGRLHGRSDLPLSIDGRASVHDDARRLAAHRIPVIYHPPDDAGTETAQIIARAVGAKAKSIGGLAEPDLGVLDGMTLQSFAERFPKRYKQWEEDPVSLSLPEGEDVAEARSRLFATFSRLLRRTRGEEAGIVLHSIGLGLLRCWLAERPPTHLWRLVRERPRVERYALATDMIEWLGEAAKGQFSQA